MNIKKEKQINDVLRIIDWDSPFRKNLLKKLFINSIDATRFYDFMGRLSQRPVIGSLLKKTLKLYYRYIHTNSIKLPMEQMEQVISSAEDLYVTPCPCRLTFVNNSCEAPLFTCIRINTFVRGEAEWEKNANKNENRRISRDDAIEIMRNARKYGMVFSLESCIQPYQNGDCDFLIV